MSVRTASQGNGGAITRNVAREMDIPRSERLTPIEGTSGFQRGLQTVADWSDISCRCESSDASLNRSSCDAELLHATAKRVWTKPQNRCRASLTGDHTAGCPQHRD